MAEKGKSAKRPKQDEKSREPQESGPEIRVGPPVAVGRTTLEDIENDLRRAPWPRAPLVTVSYEETAPAPPPKPGRRPLAPPARVPMTSAPEIEIRLTNAGRDTLSAIDDGEGELDDPAPKSAPSPKSDALELRTFVVPATTLPVRASEEQKRTFVRDRLAHRLPCPPHAVRRVDIKPFEPGVVVLRVWCPVDLRFCGWKLHARRGPRQAPLMDESTKELLERGRELYRKGDYKNAELALDQVVAQGTVFADVYDMLGVIAHSRGDLRAAETRFRQALAQNPSYTDALLNLAVTLNDQRKYDEARDIWKRLSSKTPTNDKVIESFARGKIANMHAELAQAYSDVGQIDEAIEQLEKAVRLGPSFADLRYRLGILYRDATRLEEARRTFEAAISANPKHLRSYISLGSTCLALGDKQAAREAWNDALGLGPEERDKARIQSYLAILDDPPRSLMPKPGALPSMKSILVGSLLVQMAGGTDGEGGGDGPAVLLCHGFGAPGEDLVSLHRVVDAPKGTRWFFPEAPLEVDVGMPGMPGRAWWRIDMVKLQLAMMRGELRDLARETPPGLPEAKRLLQETLRYLGELHGVRPERLVIGGFSQGAMLTTDVALTEDVRPAGLAVLSGTLLSEERWRAAASRAEGLPVFQSHGRHDPILPYAGAEALRDLLVTAGAAHRFAPFGGQHEIPGPVLAGLGAFLREVLA